MNSKHKTRQYIIERLSAGNLNAITELHAMVYKTTPRPDFFKKKYDTAYTGSSHVGFVAYNKQHLPIAYFGVIPTLLWCDGKVVLAAQSADTMTHPRYRDRGLYVELAKLTSELCIYEGISLLFGFPNQNSLPGRINNLKWKLAETMDRFVIPVPKAIPLEKLVNKFSFIKPVYEAYKRRVLKKYSMPLLGIANSVLADNYNGVLREDNYLRYKTYSSTQVIKLGGSTIWMKVHNGFIIGDISGTDHFDTTIGLIIKLARKLGVQQIHFHSSPGTRLHKLFAERYEAIPSFAVTFKAIRENISFDKIKFTFADIDIF